MRRREKFVIVSAVLSIFLLAVQYVNIEWRYLAIAGLMVITYFISAWALNDDLDFHEWFTILPLPSLYAGSVSFFYFLLPESWYSKVGILFLFGIGMYALFLTANIYSVAKGRTIQLLYAAHSIGLFFTLLTSLLFTNTIFSLRLPFWGNSIFVGLIHFPLIFISLWSVNLHEFIEKHIIIYSSFLSVFMAQVAVLFSFMPMPVWNISLFVMTILYIVLGIMHSFLKGRLFKNTMNEYLLVSLSVFVLFLILLPWK